MHCSDSNILLSNADHCICTLAHCNVHCALDLVCIGALENFIALHESLCSVTNRIALVAADAMCAVPRTPTPT